MGPLVAGGLISGAASLASSLIQNQGSKKSQQRANQYNLDQWNRTNAYNHPSQQMARLQEAGLNPNLIYGNSGNTQVGNAAPVTPAKAADYKMDNPLSDLGAFAQLRKTGAQTDNVSANTTVQVQDKLLKSMQTGESAARTAKTQWDTKSSQDLFSTSLEAAKANVKRLEADAVSADLDARFKDKSLTNRLMDIKYRAEFAKRQSDGQALQNQLRQLQVELKREGIEPHDPFWSRIFLRNKQGVSKFLNKANKFNPRVPFKN